MALLSSLNPSRFISPLRARQLQRALRNLKLTMICGLLTILVLRGTLGAGKFGTPAKDLEEIKYQFGRIQSMHARKLSSRVLAEVLEERHRPLESILSQAQPTSYDANYEELDANPTTEPYSLGPKVSDWDSQRRSAHLNLKSSGGKKPTIMLVTGSQPSACENPAGDHFLLKYMKNKMDYCRLHGIEIFYNMAHLDAEMSGFWAKLPLLRQLMLTHPEVEWFWWMDSDAVFTDMAFELPIEKYDNYNMVLHGWNDMVYKKKNWIGLNTGSFLIRNCQWSLDMLDAWAPMGPKGMVRNEAGKLLSKSLSGRPPFEADDQSAFIYLLINEREKWGEKVYLENSFYLHGYWKIIVEQYEEMMEKNHNGIGDERWPFVTHFVGCKPCKKANKGDYNAEQCFRHMERAFNFADNQVLELYGFQHKSLSSSAVLRFRGSGDDLMVQPLPSTRPLAQQTELTAGSSSI
ncbi:hypothetical protein GOP47_0020645 [Adiantum capillus-veneris]|uniref:Xyloglucan 6-xylosyltransferase n=1 Tax=Adiantum capillus-veneris TaxID=13818 RepID=A0A9D4UA36_ADICA|nr:hypothetical protein GOP47_0020645 [Adiantum capillus-veneris]